MRDVERRQQSWPQVRCCLCEKLEGKPMDDRFLVMRSAGGYSWGMPMGYHTTANPGFAFKAMENGAHKHRPYSDTVHVLCDECWEHYKGIRKNLEELQKEIQK
jgi:hypothetical protein